MSLRIRLGAVFALTLASGAAQQSQPALMPCGAHGEIEIYCGTRQPEDLELTPDGKFLIATRYIDEGKGNAGGGVPGLFDLSKKTFRTMTQTAGPDKAWGDPACPGPIGEALVSHGSSLRKRRDGRWALYLVNHGGRQSIEMYELRKAAGAWELIWRGCEVAAHEYNDVAILPDGGFVGTYPTGLSGGGGGRALAGGPTGYVARWTPGKGESEAPGTRIRLPNGVVVSADGRSMYLNEFGARQVLRYDLAKGVRTGSAKVDFLPDNLTWTKAGKLLAAGIKGTRGECPEGSSRQCIDGFGVAEIDPVRMEARPIFDSATVEPLISGVSVALAVDRFIYLGAFRGDRVVRIPYK